AADPVPPTPRYAADNSAFTYKTPDAGAHWTRVTAGLNNFALAIDPATPSIVYAATRDGVFKSTDGGASWSPRNSGLPCDGCLGLECQSCDASVLALAVDPVRPTIVYAGTYGGIFKSTDGGDGWVKVHHGAGYAFAVDPSAPRKVYAISDAGVLTSPDRGQTWSPAGLSVEAHNLALDPHHPSTVYAGTTRGVFKRRASGEPWRRASRGLVAVTVDTLAVDCRRPRTLYAFNAFGPLFRSRDRGARWRHIGLGPLAFTIDPRRPTILYAGTSDGVSKSTDGGTTWHHTVIDDDANVATVVVYPSEPSKIYAVANLDDRGVIFKSIDAGRNWYLLWDSFAPEGPPGFLRTLVIDPANPAILYAASEYEG